MIPKGTRLKEWKQFICPICGKEFELPPWAAKRRAENQKYCSLVCKHIGHRNRFAKVCRYCGKSFEVMVCLKDKQHYCSKQCRLDDGWNPSDPDKHSIFTCDWCHCEFEDWTYRQPRFCSAQCRSEYAAHLPKPWKAKPEIHITLQCAYCGNDYQTTTHQVRFRGSRFCSLKCRYEQMSIERRGKGNPHYNGGHISNYGPNWHRQRRKATKRDNHTCQVCGYHSGGDKFLDVHHIVPIKKYGSDLRKANRLSNLICLCRTCHAKVEAGKIECPPPTERPPTSATAPDCKDQ